MQEPTLSVWPVKETLFHGIQTRLLLHVCNVHMHAGTFCQGVIEKFMITDGNMLIVQLW